MYSNIYLNLGNIRMYLCNIHLQIETFSILLSLIWLAGTTRHVVATFWELRTLSASSLRYWNCEHEVVLTENLSVVHNHIMMRCYKLCNNTFTSYCKLGSHFYCYILSTQKCWLISYKLQELNASVFGWSAIHFKSTSWLTAVGLPWIHTNGQHAQLLVKAELMCMSCRDVVKV